MTTPTIQLRFQLTTHYFFIIIWICTILAAPSRGFAFQITGTSQQTTLSIDSGHTGFIEQMCMSPDKHYLATLGSDRQLLIWDLRSGESKKKYLLKSLFGFATEIEFTPDSKYVLAADGVGITSYPVDQSMGRPKKIYGDLAYGITFSSDGKQVAINGDGKLLEGSYHDGILAVVPKLSVDSILGMTFSSDGSHLAFVEDGKGIAEIAVEHPDPVWLTQSTDEIQDLTYTAHDRLLARIIPKVAPQPGVHIIDARTGGTLVDNQANCLGDLNFSNDGKVFSCVVVDSTGLNRNLSTFSLADGHLYDMHTMAPRSAWEIGGARTAFSRDQSIFAYSYAGTMMDVRLLRSWSTVPQHFSGATHPVRSLDWIPGAPYLSIRGDIDAGFLDGTAGVVVAGGSTLGGTFDFSADGRFVAYSCVQAICVQDRHSASVSQIALQPGRVVTNMAIAADGSSVMWESVNENLKDRKLQWWNSSVGTKDICSGLGYESTFQRSPTGVLIASSCHGLKIWRMKDGEVAADFSDDFHTSNHYAISWDDKRIAIGSGYSISIRNIADRSVAATIPLRRGTDSSLSNLPIVASLRFEPKGHLLGVVTDGGAAHPLPRAVVWDPNTGHDLRSIESVGPVFTTIEIAADTDSLFIGAEDGFVYLYGPQNDLRVQVASMGEFGWLAATPDGLFDGTAAAFTFARWKSGGRMSPSIDSLYSTYFSPGLVAQVIANKPPTSSKLPKISELLASPGIDALLMSGAAFLRPSGTHTKLCLPTPSPLIVQTLSLTQRGSAVQTSNLEESYSDDPSCPYSRMLPGAIANYELSSTSSPTTSSKVDLKKSDAVVLGGRVHVLSIGEGKYADSAGWPQLESPKVDALRIVDDMRRLFGSEYVDVDIAPVIDATKAQIYNALLSVLPKLKAEDTFVIYLSGHGMVPPGQEMFYFVPIDAPGHSLGDMQESAISTASIVDFVRALPCRHVVILIDACQSGGALDSLQKIAEVRVMLGGQIGTEQKPSVHIVVSSTSLQNTLTREALPGNSAGGFFLDSLGETLASSPQTFSDIEDKWAKSLLDSSSAIGLPQNMIHFDAGPDLLLSRATHSQ